MVDPSRTVFISYRRDVSRWLARAVFQDLRANDYDVFMDVESIDSGEFERVILTQIDARAHFIVILEPGSLDRIDQPGDWLRREIARAIASERNIVPMTAGGLRLGPGLGLPDDIDRLAGFNALNVPEDYFDDAMDKLRERFLRAPAPALIPAPRATEAAVSRKIEHALEPLDLGAGLAGLDLSAASIGGRYRAVLAPRLTGEPFPGGASLSWSTVLGATEYVLERGLGHEFTAAVEVYRGPVREYRDGFLIAVDWHYRVRAQTFLAEDGPWSGPVIVRPGEGDALGALRSPLFEGGSPPFAGLGEPAKPSLSSRLEGLATILEWTAVPLAVEYVLESRPVTMGEWTEVYRGDRLSFTPPFHIGRFRQFRVRAVSPLGVPIGDWSDSQLISM